MTRGDLVTRVARKLGMVGDTDEIKDLRAFCNEGVVDVLLKTHCYIERGDMTLIQGVSEYRLDSAILAIDDGRGSTPAGIGPYEVITLADMIDYQSMNPVGSGVRKYVSIAGDLLTVAPAPDSSSEVLRFWYVPRPAEMTDDDDDPSLAQFGGVPTEHHRAIEYYMLWQAAEYDDKLVGETADKARSNYESECKDIRRRLRKKQSRGLTGGRVGYPPRFRSGRRDVYPEY